MSQADIGLIGLAVMGQNLALNIHDRGFGVAVYNRTAARTDEFMQGPAKGTAIIPTFEIAELAAKLAKPRRVILMVRAGEAVDLFIQSLLPHLEPGDIVIDGGNSRYTDSERRMKELAPLGIRFVGCGISGGEEGARHGPSIMPGGDPEAWPRLRPIFQAIAAKADGEPCCQWVGEGGAGHYVKMVHNGIEYGDMQLIAEAYDLLRHGFGLSIEQTQQAFSEWNSGVLDSYLIEITAEILKARDSDGAPLIDKILDAAGQKGTGKWTGISALDLGVPLTLIGEAVFARCLSARKEERQLAEKRYGAPQRRFDGIASAAIDDLRDALYASKIVSYAQGYMLLREADRHYGWNLHYGDIALMWRGGCIIRSRFLGDIKAAFDKNPGLENLLLDEFFHQAIVKADAGWRRTLIRGIELGLPLPAFTSALAFFDGYRSGRLPADMIQAQRDYFGAHTFERVDRPRGEFFHHDWIGSGGAAASTTYQV